MLETDLYPPVRDYFLNQGFVVDAEVRDCDVVAIKDDLVIITELKTSLNIKLLVQATDRQKLSHDVYLAVPEPPRKNRQYRGVERLVKRLGLGLILVRSGSLGWRVTERFAPSHSGRINKRARTLLLAEFSGRSHRFNTGGTKQKIMTAYKEAAIGIATMMAECGPQKVKPVRLAFGDKSARILLDNHYGWFERVTRGVYDLTDRGKTEVREYPEVYDSAVVLVKTLLPKD